MCLANLLLISAVSMQFAALLCMPVQEMPLDNAVMLYNAVFVVGLFLPGPVGAYMVDKFRRKNVYSFSLIILLAVTALMYVSRGAEAFITARLVGGVMVGLAQITLGSTLLNDLAVSQTRTSSDYSFAWSALVAIPAGLGLGYFVISVAGFNTVLAVSAAMLLVSLMLVSSLEVPFRAPMCPPLFGLDRFWQKNDLVPFLNLLLASVPLGALIVTLTSWHFWAFAAIGALATRLVRRQVFRNADMRAEIVAGLLCVFFALLIILLRVDDGYRRTASFMFGAGMALASTRFLLYFLKLTGHCQRGTAQNTYMLARECGYAAGFAVALLTPAALELSLAAAILSALFYVFVTHPWFMRHNDRGFKFREV